MSPLPPVPLRNGNDAVVEQSWLEAWYALYGNAAWVASNVRQAISYLHDKPSKRPAKNARAYLGNWLRREANQFNRGPVQDPGAPRTAQATPTPVSRPQQSPAGAALRKELLEHMLYVEGVAVGNVETWLEPIRVSILHEDFIELSLPNTMCMQHVNHKWGAAIVHWCRRQGIATVAFTDDSRAGGA